MEQTATVRTLYTDGTAEIVCRRASACGGDCADCGGCSGSQAVLARAANPIGAKPGDRVLVQCPSGRVLGAAILVYLLPLVLLFAGVALAGGWGAAAVFVLGFVPAVWIDRRLARKRGPVYTISSFADGDLENLNTEGNHDLD